MEIYDCATVPHSTLAVATTMTMHLTATDMYAYQQRVRKLSSGSLLIGGRVNTQSVALLCHMGSGYEVSMSAQSFHRLYVPHYP